MLLLIIQWLVISLISLTFGQLFLTGLSKTPLSDGTDQLPPIFIFLLGFSLITFLGNLWSLFLPIGFSFQCLLLLITVSALLISKSKLRPKKIHFFLLIPLTLIALSLALHPTSNVDEAGYYLPQVKWIESYPVVKGSALFIARLGFNSAFHMLSAIFGFTALYSGGIYELNGLLFIWFNYYFLSAALRLYKSQSHNLIPDTLLTAALIFPFSFLIDAMDSDYLVTMASIVLIAKFLEELKHNRAFQLTNILVYLLITSLLVQTKPFTGLLFIAPLIMLFFSHYSLRLRISVLLFSLAIISPWLIRNWLISGYLVFPAYYLDLFDCAWKIPREMAQASLDIIAEHAKVQSIRLDYKLAGIEKLDLSTWLPQWLAFQKEQLIGWFSLVMLPLSIIIGILSSIQVITKKIEKKTELGFLLFSFVVIVFWFFNFPAIRFGWSWILSFIAISGTLVVQLFLEKWKRIFIFSLLIIACLSWARLGLRSIIEPNYYLSHLIFPPKTVTTTDHSISYAGKLPIKIASDAYCHGIEPPCQPHNNPYEIIPLGPTIEEGFRIKE